MNSVSIIIPTRNEESFISNCLISVLNFEGIDKIRFEILVVDGNSEDKTQEKVSLIARQNPCANIRIINNSHIFQAHALNLGIMEAKFDYVLRIDAHSIYPPNYLKLLFETAIRTKADNSGGILITRSYNNTYQAQLVQALTTHKFGVGNSGFRTGTEEGVADTVPFGFFKKEVFSKIGFFDERLVRGQDYEFNQRIRKFGGIIWLNPNIRIEYFNQPSIYKFLKKQFLDEGPYNAYMWYLAPYTFAFRHSIPMFFTAGIFVGLLLSVFSSLIFNIFIIILIVYGLLAFLSSLQQAKRYSNISFVLILPFCFFALHFLYGLGILSGLLKLLIRISPVQKNKALSNKQIIDY